MSEKLFEGLMVPLFSPLDENECIIKADLVKHVRYLLSRGANGFLVPSGTGEFQALTTEERRRSVEIVAQEAKGKALIVSMVSECGVKKVLQLADDARQAGADGVMVSPPYYVPIDQETLKRFILTIADQSQLPVWLYHQPTHTKMSFEPALVTEFAKHPNIAGLKSSAWKDMLYYHELVRVLRGQSRFRLLMGEDFNNLSGLILYGHGMVSTQSNINPDAFVGLWKAIKAEELAKARKLQDFIMDVEEQLLFRFPNWQGIGKLVLKKKGIFSSINCCEPCPVLTKPQQKEIEKVAKSLGLF